MMREVHAPAPLRFDGPAMGLSGRTFCGMVSKKRQRFTVTSDPRTVTCRRCSLKLLMVSGRRRIS